jgi:hypothetical protein
MSFLLSIETIMIERGNLFLIRSQGWWDGRERGDEVGEGSIRILMRGWEVGGRE